MNKKARELKNYYLTKEFEDKYNYEGELGACAGEKGTEIRLWSPMAESVNIRFFENGTEGEPENIIKMNLTDRGVWEYITDKL